MVNSPLMTNTKYRSFRYWSFDMCCIPVIRNGSVNKGRAIRTLIHASIRLSEHNALVKTTVNIAKKGSPTFLNRLIAFFWLLISVCRPMINKSKIEIVLVKREVMDPMNMPTKPISVKIECCFWYVRCLFKLEREVLYFFIVLQVHFFIERLNG